MLLDTSGLLCYLSRQELHHQKAVEFLDLPNRLFLTHSYVLAELVALALVRGFPRSTVLAFSLELIDNPEIEMVWVDEKIHRQAMQLLGNRLDKTYSLCDAVSFVLMQQRKVTEALTTDRHFEQEGFIRLLQ